MRVSLFPRQVSLPTEVPAGLPTAVPTGLPTAIPTGLSLPTGTGTSAPAATGTSSPGGVMSTVGGVKDTFTSWDKCMSKTYCKWPVIAVIIVGSLILLSVLFCIGRCLCCGAECACCCFRCCAGCCGGGRNKKHKHLDSIPPTPYDRGIPAQAWSQQYQSQPQPAYHSPLAAGPTPFQSSSAAVPQFATFESPSKKIHEDSLPAMPSWETAASKKVEVWEEPEAHELEKLNPNGQSTVTTFNSVASPQPVRPGPGPPSPYSENDTFLAGGNHQYGASQYSLTGGQTSGITRGDGYQGTSPAPNQFGGYAPHNVSQPSIAQQYSGSGQSPYGQTQRGYGQQPYGGSQQNYDRQNDPYHAPVSPVYAPSGSTAYEPQRQQDHSPPYGGGGYGQQGRRPVNGSWKDV